MKHASNEPDFPTTVADYVTVVSWIAIAVGLGAILVFVSILLVSPAR